MAIAQARPRVVVVGLGSIGRRHARLLSARGDLQVEWCESSAAVLSQAASELGVPARVHGDFEAAIASQPTMIVVATPHEVHAPQAIAALNAGIHVLCEKPLSDTLSAATAIVAAAARSAAVLTVGFQRHFHPVFRRVKDLLAGGELGSLHHLHAHIGTYVTLVNSRSRYQADLAGALFMDYAHQPDLFFHLSGERPEGVYTAAGLGGTRPLRSNPNFAVVLCDYARPFISSLSLNYLQFPERHVYEIVGDRAWLTIDLPSGSLRMGSSATNSVATESFSTDRDLLYQAEHQAFLDAIDGKRPPESPAADALVSMQAIDAAIRSWRCGARVPLVEARADAARDKPVVPSG